MAEYRKRKLGETSSATSKKRQKLYLTIDGVDTECISTSAFSTRNILICVCKALNAIDETQRYSLALTSTLLAAGVPSNVLLKGVKGRRALTVKAYVYDHIALLMLQNKKFKRVLFNSLAESERPELKLLLGRLTEPAKDFLCNAGESLLAILAKASKKLSKRAAKQPQYDGYVHVPAYLLSKMPNVLGANQKEKSRRIFGREDIPQDLLNKFSKRWKMAATGVEEVENFKMLLKHLNVPWLIRQAFLSIVSDFSVSCNHSQKVSFFAHANSNCGTPAFSLDCHGAMYKANFPCIDRVASWACGKVLTKSQYTFEAVDNSLRFSCDLIERNERFTISAHFDEKGDMITTWQIHSLVSGTCPTLLCTASARYIPS